MPNLPHLYLFTAAAFVILIIPGPAVLYVALQSVQQGRIAGIVAVLGLEFGTLFHVTAVALGISTLMSSSVPVFNLLRGLGTAYLVYLGLCKLLPPRKMQHNMGQFDRLQQVFWQGLLVELFNPKTLLFFFAFLPQFVIPTSGSVTLQVLILGLLFVGLAIVIDLLYAMLAGSVAHWFRKNRWLLRKQRYVESSVYFGLSIATALAR